MDFIGVIKRAVKELDDSMTSIARGGMNLPISDTYVNAYAVADIAADIMNNTGIYVDPRDRSDQKESKYIRVDADEWEQVLSGK